MVFLERLAVTRQGNKTDSGEQYQYNAGWSRFMELWSMQDSSLCSSLDAFLHQLRIVEVKRKTVAIVNLP